MELRRYRPLALLLLVLHLAGCYSWQPATVGPRQFIEEERPGQIRIVQTDGEQMELRNPRIEADSLTARISTRLRTGNVRIALSDIDSIEARRFSVARTLRNIGLAFGLSGLSYKLLLELTGLGKVSVPG